MMMSDQDDTGRQGNDLEPQQYQRMYWEADVPVKDIRHSLLRRLLLSGILLFVLIISIAAVVKFPDQLSIFFILKSDQQEELYKFPFPVYLLDKHVTTGQHVEAGDTMLMITSPEIIDMLYALDKARRNLDQYTLYQKPYAGNEREMLYANQEQNKIRLNEIQLKLDNIKHVWKSNEARLQSEYTDAGDKLEAYKKLLEAKDITRFDVTALEQIQRRVADELMTGRLLFEKEKLGLETQIDEMRLDQGIGQNKMAQLEHALGASYNTLNNEFLLAQAKIQQLFGPFEVGEGSIILKAPEAGMVRYIFEGEKEIEAGVTLLRLQKNENGLYAFAKCPPAMKGKLKVDMHSLLKVHSFPFYEYGSVRGHIQYLSMSPDEKGEYNLQIQIDEPGNLEGLLQDGLSGDAVVIIQEKTMLQYFFRGIRKSVNTFMEGPLGKTR